MPLYEYRCRACGQTEERLEPLAAPEVHACAHCGAPMGMERQLSVPALAMQEARSAGGLAEAPPCASGGGCEAGCPFAS
ncbi:MAG: zinc ribbon domain-containing protein [Holophaga sp.]|jgi:putative FmdB family regulatory protein